MRAKKFLVFTASTFALMAPSHSVELSQKTLVIPTATPVLPPGHEGPHQASPHIYIAPPHIQALPHPKPHIQAPPRPGPNIQAPPSPPKPHIEYFQPFEPVAPPSPPKPHIEHFQSVSPGSPTFGSTFNKGIQGSIPAIRKQPSIAPSFNQGTHFFNYQQKNVFPKNQSFKRRHHRRFLFPFGLFFAYPYFYDYEPYFQVPYDEQQAIYNEEFDENIPLPSYPTYPEDQPPTYSNAYTDETNNQNQASSDLAKYLEQMRRSQLLENLHNSMSIFGNSQFYPAMGLPIPKSEEPQQENVL